MRIARFVSVAALVSLLVTPAMTFPQAKPIAAQGAAASTLKQDMRQLMKNQDDLGNAVARYYRADAGRRDLSSPC